MNKPVLSKQAFWDVDMNKIDYQKNAGSVVEKVIERVKELALQALWLSDISINSCSTLFEVNPTDFKCYKKKRLNLQHWVC